MELATSAVAVGCTGRHRLGTSDSRVIVHMMVIVDLMGRRTGFGIVRA